MPPEKLNTGTFNSHSEGPAVGPKQFCRLAQPPLIMYSALVLAQKSTTIKSGKYKISTIQKLPTEVPPLKFKYGTSYTFSEKPCKATKASKFRVI